MNPPYKTVLFIFRRDLRLADNTGLSAAAEQAEQVIPCFIVDPRQAGEENAYRSDNCIQFMIESLGDLQKQLEKQGGKLYLFHGVAHEILEKLLDTIKIDAVFYNRDYTPFSIKRDENLEHVCNRHQVDFHQYGDVLLNEPEEVISQSGTPYVVFSAFFKKAAQRVVRKPHNIPQTTWYTKPITLAATTSIFKQILPKPNPDVHVHGGRTEGLKLVRSLGQLKNYGDTHDVPSMATSNLSAHNKFGTISIREVYYAIREKLGPNHPLIRQLYWRDFFTHVAYFSPFIFGHAFQQKFDNLAWEHNKKKFKQWCEGRTGFPIVDAGMRQLIATGFMHNRVRMIVASFLTKDLRIDWRWGEKFFAQHLVDYDPAVNNGNWQWCASTGCDAQPYFRIFNPWLQQKKFDPECEYIKQWVPELKGVPPKVIHTWYNPKHNIKVEYPKPMVDHAQEARTTKAWFKDQLK